MEKKKYVILIVVLIIILTSILVPVRNEKVMQVDQKDYKTITTSYKAYFNIYGMRIYNIVIDRSERSLL